MSKRSYPVWDYPSNTKQNPIPPAKSAQERNRGVGIPQSQQSRAPTLQSTTPTQRGIVPERGQNARQNYKPPTSGRPTSTGAQPWLRNSGAGKQTPGTTGTIRRTGATGTARQTGTSKSTGTTGKPPYRSSYASAADFADMNEIMGVSSYTGEAQDVADNFLRQNGVSSPEEYQKKFFTEQTRKQQEREARRRAQEERARQYREQYGDEEAAAEYMGLRGGYTGEVDDLVQAEWRKNGVSDAAGYRKVADYRWRNMAGGAVDTLRNSANDLSYRLQDGRAEQLAENDAMRDAANGKGNYEDLYRYYLAKYREETKDFVPVKAVDWGEAYNAETARIADEEGFNDYVRKDGELSRALGAMAPSLAASAAGNLVGGALALGGAYGSARAAAKVGKALSASMTFSSASGAAYEEAIANGMTPDKAMQLATAAGTIELGTEVLNSGLGRFAGKKLGIGGAADKFLESLAGKLTSDPLVQSAFVSMSGILGEGFEEFLSEWCGYAAQKALDGYDTRTMGEVWKDSLAAFRDGAFVAGLLNATTLLQCGVPPQTAIEVGVDEAMAQDNALPRKDAAGRKIGTTVSVSEIVGKISDSLRQKLPERDFVQFNEAFENSPAGNQLSEVLAGMDSADAARVTEAVTGAVADAVKRGESYSSLEDFLTDESVERMTEAVIEETAKTLGLADAEDTGVNEKRLGDSRVAALKDMAKESLTEQFRKDGELRDTAERVRQKRGSDSSDVFADSLIGEPEAPSSDMETLYKDFLEGKLESKEGADGDGMLSDPRPRNNQEIQNYIEKLKEESSRMQEKRTKDQMSDPKIKEGSEMRIEKDSANKEFVEDPFRGKDKLKADVKYRAGEFGYMYETDGLGRICRFFAEKLQLTARDKRLRHDPNTPGKMQYDDAGHLIGDRFGGAATITNLVSQLRSVNRGDYRVMEDHLESVIQNGGTVEMEGRIIYNESDLRPAGISIEIKIDGEAVPIFFSNIQ